MATIRDVARRAGVSISTVSLALNQSGPVSVETHEKVWAWGDVIRPRITMVVQPITELARIASECLLERINARGADAGPPRESILVPKLVVGQSCARPAH